VTRQNCTASIPTKHTRIHDTQGHKYLNDYLLSTHSAFTIAVGQSFKFNIFNNSDSRRVFVVK